MNPSPDTFTLRVHPLLRGLRPKMLLDLVSSAAAEADMQLVAHGRSGQSRPLHIRVPAGERLSYPVVLPRGTIRLTLSGAAGVRASMRLAATALAQAALSPASLANGLKAHARAVDMLGRDLFYARAFDAPYARLAQSAPLPASGTEQPDVTVLRPAPSGENDGLSELCGPLNDTLPQVKSTYVLVLREGDRLLPGARAAFAKALREHPAADLILCDYLLCDAEGTPQDRILRGPWNAAAIRDGAEARRASLIRTEPLRAALSKGLSFDEAVMQIGQGSSALLPQAVLALNGPDAPLPLPALTVKPLVSLVIPTRNGLNLLQMLFDTLRLTAYAPYEVIVVDNGSDDPSALRFLESLASEGRARILRDDGDFNFSRLMNEGFAAAKGELLLALNNDIEIVDPRWLDELVAVARTPGTGIVAPLLLYPDGRVQHAGLIMGVAQACEHIHRFADPRDLRPNHRSLAAVTGACLLITREAWDAAGPFDEETFPIGFNDIDLCLKARQKGYDVVFTPRTRLIHHESVTRGHDTDPARIKRALAEAERFCARWPQVTRRDPLLSPHVEARAWPVERG